TDTRTLRSFFYRQLPAIRGPGHWDTTTIPFEQIQPRLCRGSVRRSLWDTTRQRSLGILRQASLWLKFFDQHTKDNHCPLWSGCPTALSIRGPDPLDIATKSAYLIRPLLDSG